jgi:multidrug efflux pump
MAKGSAIGGCNGLLKSAGSPLLIASGPGAAARFSIDVAIASGMTIGTAFTLFVLPAFYLHLAQDRSKAQTKDNDAEPSLPTVTSTPH